jgi:hypothetical protein
VLPFLYLVACPTVDPLSYQVSKLSKLLKERNVFRNVHDNSALSVSLDNTIHFILFQRLTFWPVHVDVLELVHQISYTMVLVQ